MNRPPEVSPAALFAFFGEHGAALDNMGEQLQELYDEGRRSLPPAAEEWHRLTGKMIKEYDLQRYERESAAMQKRNVELRTEDPGAPREPVGIKEESDNPGGGETE